MYCNKCGLEILEGSEFCKHCGSSTRATGINDVIRNENDADGENYIAVGTNKIDLPMGDTTVKVEPKAPEQPVVKEPVIEEQEEPNETVQLKSFVEEVENTEFKSFVEDEEKTKKKTKKKKNKAPIILGMCAALAIVGCTVFFMTRDKAPANGNITEVTYETDKETTTTKDENNGYFEKKYDNGSTYKGNLTNGQWDGQGTLTYADGTVIEGTFTNGNITGFGTIKYPNGDVYQGEYSSGEKSGSGTLIYKNGDKYKGAFANDKKQGNGELWFTNGNYYKGIFENDLMHGEGTLTYKNKEYHKGNFKNGLRYGMGEYHLANGDILYGYWLEDSNTGYFTYYDKANNFMYDEVYVVNGVRK